MAPLLVSGLVLVTLGITFGDSARTCGLFETPGAPDGMAYRCVTNFGLQVVSMGIFGVGVAAGLAALVTAWVAWARSKPSRHRSA